MHARGLIHVVVKEFVIDCLERLAVNPTGRYFGPLSPFLYLAQACVYSDAAIVFG